MSAECSKCGLDIVYPEGSWPVGECPACDRSVEITDDMVSRAAVELDVLFHGGYGQDWDTHDAARRALDAALGSSTLPRGATVSNEHAGSTGEKVKGGKVKGWRRLTRPRCICRGYSPLESVYCPRHGDADLFQVDFDMERDD